MVKVNCVLEHKQIPPQFVIPGSCIDPVWQESRQESDRQPLQGIKGVGMLFGKCGWQTIGRELVSFGSTRDDARLLYGSFCLLLLFVNWLMDGE